MHCNKKKNNNFIIDTKKNPIKIWTKNCHYSWRLFIDNKSIFWKSSGLFNMAPAHLNPVPSVQDTVNRRSIPNLGGRFIYGYMYIFLVSNSAYCKTNFFFLEISGISNQDFRHSHENTIPALWLLNVSTRNHRKVTVSFELPWEAVLQFYYSLICIR